MKLLLALAVAAAVAVVVGMPGDEQRRPEPRAAIETATPPPDARPRRRDVPRSRCPADVPGCKAVRGTVVYVERVDPDGDGDLHVVVDAGSVTLTGLTAIDVRRGLRPRRDPRPGDRVSAAGPVQTGSYGQSQIHALEFHVRG